MSLIPDVPKLLASEAMDKLLRKMAKYVAEELRREPIAVRMDVPPVVNDMVQQAIARKGPTFNVTNANVADAAAVAERMKFARPPRH